MDNASGIVYPYFDLDTNMLYCPGKGEGNIKYFDVSNGAITYFNNYSSTVPQKSVAFFPKRAMNVFKSEEARAAKLTNNTIEYLSFKVPKRNEGFHADAYVDCLNGEVALSFDDWVKGETKDPPRTPIDKIESSWSVRENKFEHAIEKKDSHLEDDVQSLKDRIHELEADNKNLKDLVAHTEEKLNNALAELAHLRGDKEDDHKECHKGEEVPHKGEESQTDWFQSFISNWNNQN